jgi:hypothetical protein
LSTPLGPQGTDPPIALHERALEIREAVETWKPHVVSVPQPRFITASRWAP